MDMQNMDLMGGSLQISTDVIAKIARFAALEIDGAADVSCGRQQSKKAKELLELVNIQPPVTVEMREGTADITLNLIVRFGTCVPVMAEKVQKNVKNAEGKWEEQPFYTIEDTLFYGHGEASVYILSSYIRLSREEALAIRWHMSGFDCAVKGGERAINGAYENYPLCAKLACADMLATYVNKL